MKIRHQVFVSSTYEDLRAERQAVIQALLSLDCIPAGMELFNASDDDQWTLIKRVIDESDYYTVIVAGRYGSCRPDGMGYTEMEYDYAIEKKKPVIAFIHGKPGKILSEKTELDPAAKAKLDKFLEKAKKKTVKFWTSPEDLVGKVVLSIAALRQNHPAGGWVQAKYASSPEESLRLRSKIEELEDNLREARTAPPPGTEALAQGGDQVSLTFKAFKDISELQFDQRVDWDAIFARIGPLMLEDCAERNIDEELAQWLAQKRGVENGAGLDRESLNLVIVQLRALGLIVKSDRKRTASDKQTYWSLTQFGDNYLTRLVARPKEAKEHARKD